MISLLIRSAQTGERLEMIYLSEKQQLSQRVIKVLEVQNDTIKAYCFIKRTYRTFKMTNILSIVPARLHAQGSIGLKSLRV